MTVSVIVRSRNEAPRLRLVLQSLERQHGLDEVVVVDDGSTDETSDVLSEASHHLPLVVVHNQTAQGRSAASNAGAATATGRLLIFLDGDMIAGPGLVAQHRARHAEAGAPMICRGSTWHLRCTRVLLDPERGLPFPEHADRHARLSQNEQQAMRVTSQQVREEFGAVERRAQKGIYPGSAPGLLHDAEMAALQGAPNLAVLWAAASGSNQSVPRAAFLQVGGFDVDIDINEHRELARRLMLSGVGMAGLASARTYHLIHRSGWRDPLAETSWEDKIWRRHPVPEIALLPIFWASLSAHPAITPQMRINSLAQLADIAAAHSGLTAGSAPLCRAMMGYPERLA